MAPQCVWPQTITFPTSSSSIAYSIAAETPPSTPRSTAGTMLPTLRTMNSSPGPAEVIRVGTTRESEHVMNKVSGRCPFSVSVWKSLRLRAK